MEIKNNLKPTSERGELLRGAIEHRATWMGLLIDEAKKAGLSTEFAHNAVLRCGCFHGETKQDRSGDLKKFAAAFANQDVRDVFEMDVFQSTDDELYINFHYCPLVAAWMKCGLPVEDLPELCQIAMDGDRGIVKANADHDYRFHLGETIANGDDFCKIRITKGKDYDPANDAKVNG